MNRPLIFSLVTIGLPAWALPAGAQQGGFDVLDGIIVFVDGEGDGRCAAVNTINADFFIRSCDRRLVLLRGNDRPVPFTVTRGFDVFHDSGQAAGKLRFASDRDGFRQVFWLSDTNFPEGEDLVLRYNTETDQLSVEVIEGQGAEMIPVRPINVTGTQCNPTVTFDGDETLLCRRTCGLSSIGTMLAMTLGLGLLSWRTRAQF